MHEHGYILPSHVGLAMCNNCTRAIQPHEPIIIICRWARYNEYCEACSKHRVTTTSEIRSYADIPTPSPSDRRFLRFRKNEKKILQPPTQSAKIVSGEKKPNVLNVGQQLPLFPRS